LERSDLLLIQIGEETEPTQRKSADRKVAMDNEQVQFDKIGVNKPLEDVVSIQSNGLPFEGRRVPCDVNPLIRLMNPQNGGQAEKSRLRNISKDQETSLGIYPSWERVPAMLEDL